MTILGSWRLDALIVVTAFHLTTGDAPGQPASTLPIPSTAPTAPSTGAPPATDEKAESSTTTALTGIADPHRAGVYDVRLSVDIPVIVLGATVGLLRTYLGNHYVDQRCPCSPDEINSFDRRFVGNHSDAAGLASDITVVLALSVPPILDLVVLGRKRALAEDLIVVAETVMVSTLFQQVANFGYQRPRPRTYAGDVSDLNRGEGYLSFLAGHVATTTAVLAASSYTLRRRYGEHVWPWVVTGLVAASVGVERVLGGYHFPSDVVLGAALGLGVGLAVPWLHARRPEMRLTVAPTSTGGLALLGQF